MRCDGRVRAGNEYSFLCDFVLSILVVGVGRKEEEKGMKKFKIGRETTDNILISSH
jgi:hypothetical protein